MTNPPRRPARGRAAPRVALAAVALVIALGSWWLLRPGETAGGPASLLPASRAAPDAELPPPAIAPADVAPLALAGAGPADAPPPEPAAAAEVAPSVPMETFRVVVVDLNAQPVPGAAITLSMPWKVSKDGRGIGQPESPEPTITDLAGRAEIALPASDRSSLTAEKEGVGRTDTVSYEDLVKQRDVAGEVVLRLLPDAIIDGLVLQADGAPAAGCTVGVTGTSFRTLVGEPRSRGLQGSALKATEDGRFRIALRAALAFRLWAEPKDGARIDETVVMDDDGVTEVTLRLPGDWWIEGQVLDPEGRALTSAVDVIAYRGEALRDPWMDVDKQHMPSSRMLAKVGKDGRFRLPVGALQPHVLYAAARDLAFSDPVLVTLDESHPQASVVLRLVKPVDVTGRAITADGKPAPGLVLHCPTVWPPLATLFHNFRIGGTDENGRFRVGLMHPREMVELRFTRSEKPGVISQSDPVLALRTVPAGTNDLEIVVGDVPLAEAPARRGTLRASVRSGASGLVPPQLRWRVLPEGSAGGGTVLAAAGDTGEILAQDLDLGAAYTLVVAAQGHGAVDVHGLIASEQPAPVRVDMPALAELQVEVVDRFGVPVPYAEVTIERSFATVGFHPHGPQSTDKAGRTLFTKLDAGRFRVAVQLGDGLAEQSVDVGSGESAFVRLTAPTGS